MFTIILTFLACAAVIVTAGSFLAKFADEIAEITGWGRLLIGGVLLAGATSLPELTVDITAVRMGLVDMAAGDLLGSCLMNLLILAVLDLTHHSRGKMLSRVAAGHALSGLMSIALISIVGIAILGSTQIPDWSFLGISLMSGLILAAYLLGVRMVFLDQRISARVAAEAHPHDTEVNRPLWKPAIGFVIAAAVIVLTGPQLTESASQIAEISGLGSTFVGTTFVAISTSLPELVASIAALRMGAFDLAVGNLFGSNAFNMLLFVALDVMHQGPLFAHVSSSHLVSCVASILVTAVAVMGQLYQVERRYRLIDPDAILMLLLIAGALALVYRMS